MSFGSSAVYRCSAPLDQMHLWVSVKQGGPDPTAEGSSSTVNAVKVVGPR